MSGVAKHEKASRNAKPRRRRRRLRLRSLVADLFEQRQIACRLTDNRINGCSSLSSSSSSSSSFSTVAVSFSGPLILEESTASSRRTRYFTSREVLLRPFFYPASQSTSCLPFLVIPFRARKTSGEWREKGGKPARTTLSVAAEKETVGLEESRRTKRERGEKNARGEEGAVTKKKKARENATREDLEESGGTFPPPPLSVTHFSFLLPPNPSREPLHYS